MELGLVRQIRALTRLVSLITTWPYCIETTKMLKGLFNIILNWGAHQRQKLDVLLQAEIKRIINLPLLLRENWNIRILKSICCLKFCTTTLGIVSPEIGRIAIHASRGKQGKMHMAFFYGGISEMRKG